MTSTLDIVAIGNAIVDVLAQADEALLARVGVAKGSMQWLDEAGAAELYAQMGPAREVSGGSGANTVAGMAALGARCGFIGQVADDQLGEVFAHDIRANNVVFTTAIRPGPPSTARCLILVTPDAQRTMNTFLGASTYLPEAALDRAMIASAKILYLEGYLWDPPEPRAAMRAAIAIARAAGRKVAFTLSDTHCIALHRADFRDLIRAGQIDILFANEAELAALVEHADFDAAVGEIAEHVPTLVVTRGGAGAIGVVDGIRHWVPAEPIARIVDTTGAGDLFAAGFMAGLVQERSVEDCLAMGAICAAEIIGHFGARAEADLAELVRIKLG